MLLKIMCFKYIMLMAIFPIPEVVIIFESTLFCLKILEINNLPCLVRYENNFQNFLYNSNSNFSVALLPYPYHGRKPFRYEPLLSHQETHWTLMLTSKQFELSPCTGLIPHLPS